MSGHVSTQYAYFICVLQSFRYAGRKSVIVSLFCPLFYLPCCLFLKIKRQRRSFSECHVDSSLLLDKRYCFCGLKQAEPHRYYKRTGRGSPFCP